MDIFLKFVKRIKTLPDEMTREIFSFLIPDPDKIVFRNERPCSSYNSYSPKYEVAFFQNIKIVANIITDTDSYYSVYDDYYLCRIAKKNGKHRYYITKELVDVIQMEDYNGREIDIFHYDYVSKYIGKNLTRALFEMIYK
jgi:hypothetical protein